MTKMNGTYFALHKQAGWFPYPYCKGNLTFREEENLSGRLSKLAPYGSSDTYFLTGGGKEETLIARMEEWLQDKVPEKSLFFTESNSAHHMTYFLAGERAEQLGEGEKLLVINFDQHEDHGFSARTFFCGNWGSHIMRRANCDYVVVGASNRITSFKAGMPGCQKYGLNQLAECLEQRHKDCSRIYVTVDMDVLKNDMALKRTNRNSGVMSFDVLRALLNSLPGEKITAADITGFPPVTPNYPKNNKMYCFAPYILDIKHTAEILCRLMGIAAYLPEEEP